MFSIVDSFSYRDKDETKNLTSAIADYFVIGWHSNSDDDPLAGSGDKSLSSRLRNLFLNLKANPSEGDSEAVEALLKLSDASHVLLHGAIYGVKYDLYSKPRSLADEAARKFTTDERLEPLSIGTTPLDGVLTFLEAHQGGIENVFGEGTQNVTKDILQLATLLYAADDSYDSRVKAQDMLYTNNWSSSLGGSRFKFNGKAGAGKPAAVPTADELEALNLLNEQQAQLDVMSRKLQGMRWLLFAEWWKFVSDRSNVTGPKVDEYKARVKVLKKDITDLQTATAALKMKIDENSGVVDRDSNVKTPIIPPNKKIPQSTYFTKKDPTLCIAGLDSGFPADFLDNVDVRVDHQLSASMDTKTVFAKLKNPVPTDGKLRATADKLVAGFLSRIKPTDATTYPKGFKKWGDANPFQPMFMEWEGIYYHVDRSKWDVGVRPSPVGHAHSQVRFSVDEPLYNNPDNQKDFRYVSGRVLILPQPVFSLQSIVKQVLDNPGQELHDVDVEGIKANISKLNFVSAPLDGLTNHLLTKYTGSHVTPNVRVQGKTAVPLEYAWNSPGIREVEFGKDGLALIDSER